MLEPGVYSTEWFSIDDRVTIAATATTVEAATGTSFQAPPEVSGPAILYLTRRAGDAA